MRCCSLLLWVVNGKYEVIGLIMGCYSSPEVVKGVSKILGL